MLKRKTLVKVTLFQESSQTRSYTQLFTSIVSSLSFKLKSPVSEGDVSSFKYQYTTDKKKYDLQVYGGASKSDFEA